MAAPRSRHWSAASHRSGVSCHSGVIPSVRSLLLFYLSCATFILGPEITVKGGGVSFLTIRTFRFIQVK